MARRIGSIDEFEFKDIGENHKQCVSFIIQSFFMTFFEMQAWVSKLTNGFAHHVYTARISFDSDSTSQYFMIFLLIISNLLSSA